MTETIDYNISLYPNPKHAAKHKTTAKNQPNPEIIIYLKKMMDYENHNIKKDKDYIEENFTSKEDAFFKYFTFDLIYFTILERICLECRLNNKTRVEKGLGKKRIMGRCQEYKGFACKMHYVNDKIFDQLVLYNDSQEC